MTVPVLIARLTLCVVFAAAAWTKLADSRGTREAIVAFGAPAAIAGPLALVLPVAELATAALLLPAETAIAGAVASLGLLATFSAAISVNLARGRAPDCHCFGQLHSEPAGPNTLARNGILAAAAVLVVVGGGGPSAVAWIGGLRDSALVAAAAGVAIAATTAAFVSLLRAYGRALVRIDTLERTLADAGIAVDGDVALEVLPPQHGLAPATSAPGFTVSDVNGTTVSLNDLLAPGLPLMLVFASPHCGPCSALMPEVGEWQREHADRLTVAVASDGAAQDVRAEAEELALDHMLLDEAGLYEAFRANGTPSAVLIAANGTIASWIASGRDSIRGLMRGVVDASETPVGAPAPIVELESLDGEPVTLGEPSGADTLVLFWNPGCGFLPRDARGRPRVGTLAECRRAAARRRVLRRSRAHARGPFPLDRCARFAVLGRRGIRRRRHTVRGPPRRRRPCRVAPRGRRAGRARAGQRGGANDRSADVSRMIERHVDRLARRLASENVGFVAAATPEPAFDGLARALVAPVSRRRVLAIAGGTVAAASLLRPGRAQADCFPGGPKVCPNSKGAKVCVPADLECCSNDNCAIACPHPWRVCGSPAICNDTASMCTVYAKQAGFDTTQTKFCSQQVTVTNGCVDSGESVATRGWCCKPAESCGAGFGDCVCLTVTCGSDCCKKDEECVALGLLRGESCLPKCRKGWHHDGADCVCDVGQTCGVVCCPAGKECRGSTCVSPPPPTKWPSLFDAFKGYGDSVNQTAGSRGGGHAADRRARAAAATPVGAALFALGAVNAQGLAAGSAFGDVNADNAFRRKVLAPRPAVPRIVSGAGLDQRAAAALQSLLNTEAQAFAQLLAAGVALARARGALRHNNDAAARKQVLAAAGFANKAAQALRRVPSLRSAAAAALTSTGAAEVTVSAGDVAALQAAVHAGGVPADLKAALARLGVTGNALSGVKDGLLADSVGGPALIAPLADPARTKNIQAMASELATFVRNARRRPIVRSHGEARRYRQR